MTSTERDPTPSRIRSKETTRFVLAGTAILLIAAFLRLWQFRAVPPGLAQDEILNADIVSFIWQGRLALFFREGYGHEPLYHYLAAAFQPLLGDNILAIRLPPLFLGLLLIAATMRWARRDYGRLAALAAGAGLAISWWPIIFSRIGIRPILEPLLLVLAAWALPRRAWLAGVFLGLSVYAYTGARYVSLIPAVYLLFLLFRRYRPVPSVDETGAALRQALIMLAVSLAVAVPLFLTLRADPTLQQRVDQLSGPLEALRAGDVTPILESAVATLGVFAFTGDPRWTYAVPGTPLFDLVTAVFFLTGLLLVAIRTWHRPENAYLLAWLGVGLLPSAVTPQAPSTIRMIGALPVVYLLPGIALAYLWSRVHKRLMFAEGSRLARAILSIVLVGVFVVNLGRTLRDGFIQWPAAPETRERYQTVFRNIAEDLRDNPNSTPIIADAFYEPIDHDSLRRSLGVGDLDARWVQRGRAVVLPASGNGRLYVPEYVTLNPLLFRNGIRLSPLYVSNGNPAFSVYEVGDGAPLPAPAADVTFNDKLALLGTSVSEVAADSPGVEILTYWRVKGTLPADLKIFVHLLTADSTIVAQDDAFDAAPERLKPGDRFTQVHSLRLPDKRPAGPLHLQLGVYTLGDDVRWQWPGIPGDRYLLADSLSFDE